MDAFDNVSKAINNKKSLFTQKAKDYFTVSDYESSVKQAKNEIDSLYKALGERVYLTEKTKEDSDYSTQIMEISSKYDEISKLNGEIEKVKSANRCPVCGRELGGENRFCPNCGSEILNKEENWSPESGKKRYCPQCGMALSEEALFCYNCGFKLSQIDD